MPENMVCVLLQEKITPLRCGVFVKYEFKLYVFMFFVVVFFVYLSVRTIYKNFVPVVFGMLEGGGWMGQLYL